MAIEAKLKGYLTDGESVVAHATESSLHAAAPASIIVTTKRVIHYKPGMLWGAKYEDVPLGEVEDCRIQEGLLSAKVSLSSARGQIVIEHLSKNEGKAIYRVLQELEEKAKAYRYQIELERARASSGGVVVTNAIPTVAPALPAPVPVATISPQESVQRLLDLKKLLDAGAITQSEYDAKKAELLKGL